MKINLSLRSLFLAMLCLCVYLGMVVGAGNSANHFVGEMDTNSGNVIKRLLTDSDLLETQSFCLESDHPNRTTIDKPSFWDMIGLRRTCKVVFTTSDGNPSNETRFTNTNVYEVGLFGSTLKRSAQEPSSAR